MNEIIKAEHLTKIFGDQKAVDNLSFTVHRGETLGLLGPNGAGKTTTIKMLIGLVKPTRGGAIIGGYTVQQKPIEAKELFGISTGAQLRPSSQPDRGFVFLCAAL